MTKEEEKELQKKIKAEISKVKDYSKEHLVHVLKIISSKQSKKEKALYEPLKKAIEKERKERGVSEIDTKIVPIGKKSQKSERKKR